jgi:hypothetical protein
MSCGGLARPSGLGRVLQVRVHALLLMLMVWNRGPRLVRTTEAGPYVAGRPHLAELSTTTPTSALACILAAVPNGWSSDAHHE